MYFLTTQPGGSIDLNVAKMSTLLLSEPSFPFQFWTGTDWSTQSAARAAISTWNPVSLHSLLYIVV